MLGFTAGGIDRPAVARHLPPSPSRRQRLSEGRMPDVRRLQARQGQPHRQRVPVAQGRHGSAGGVWRHADPEGRRDRGRRHQLHRHHGAQGSRRARECLLQQFERRPAHTVARTRFHPCQSGSGEPLRFRQCSRLAQCGPVDLSPEQQPDGRLSGEAAVERVSTAVQTGTPLRFDWMHKRRDGTEFLCEITLVRIALGGRPHLLTSVRDITEKKAQEAAVRTSQEQSADAGRQHPVGHLHEGPPRPTPARERLL